MRTVVPLKMIVLPGEPIMIIPARDEAPGWKATVLEVGEDSIIVSPEGSAAIRTVDLSQGANGPSVVFRTQDQIRRNSDLGICVADNCEVKMRHVAFTSECEPRWRH